MLLFTNIDIIILNCDYICSMTVHAVHHAYRTLYCISRIEHKLMA